MLHSIWLITLGVLYLFFTFSTPKVGKPPAADIFAAPIAKKIVPHAEDGEHGATTEASAETEAAPEAAAAPAVVEVEYNPVDIDKGRKIYLSTCIKCHNKDPNVKGAIGPELVDAPLEIMQHKVATGRYPEKLPEGFVPKRKTKLMTKFTEHVPDVPSIHAYVQSLKK